MKNKKKVALTAQLDKLYQQRSLVRLHRDRLQGTQSIDGYLVGAGDRWILLQVVLDGGPDGYLAVRRSDITRLDTPPGVRLARKTFQRWGIWPPHPPMLPIDLDSTRSVVTTMGDQADALTLSYERRNPHVCTIGHIVAVQDGLVHVDDITPNGRWKRHTTLRLGDLTSVGQWDRYTLTLLDTAGPWDER